MKKFVFLFAMLAFVAGMITSNVSAGNDAKTGTNPSENAGKIDISCSPGLNPLVSKWAAGYVTFNPDAQISVNDIGNHSVNGENIKILTENDAFAGKYEWKIAIGKDVIVPVINPENPYIKSIMEKGLSAKLLHTALRTKTPEWSGLLNDASVLPLKIFVTDDSFLSKAVTGFGDIPSGIMESGMVVSKEELIRAIQNDPLALGFCYVKDIIDFDAGSFTNGLVIMPIDKNMNGSIDRFESCYSNPAEFLRAVVIGKYPAALTGNIYATSAELPENQSEQGFLSWILMQGQNQLASYGFAKLQNVETLAAAKALTQQNVIETNADTPNYSAFWTLFIVGFVILGSLIILFLRSSRKSQSVITGGTLKMSSAMNEDTIKSPKGLYYDKTHTWAFMQENGIVKVGLDDFMQNVTGTLTRINMREPGTTVCKGERLFSVIRDGKQLNIYSPVTGTIVEKNSALQTASFLINASPYQEGWVYQIEPKKWLREIHFMFMADQYKEWIKNEFSRLKDFFSTSMRSNSAVYSHIILQDGGELTEHILADMGPEVWEDFQNNFINLSK